MIPKYLANPGIPTTGYDVFVEPFFGGGAMTCWIANNTDCQRFVINDINPEIVQLYQIIKHDVHAFMSTCDVFCEDYLKKDHKGRKEYYYEIRDQYIKGGYNDRTYESATLYFLMKTCFNGIFQPTKESKGRFATPCGLLNQKDRVYDRDNVLAWHEFLQRVEIKSGDWKDATDVEGRAFYFMDPPYRDSFTQYGQVFPDGAHEDLIRFCNEQDLADNLVMYCNRETADTFYADNQGDLALGTYGVTYTAGRRATEEDGARTAKKAQEILLFSKSILDQDCRVDPKAKKKAKKKPKKTKKKEESKVVMDPKLWG